MSSKTTKKSTIQHLPPVNSPGFFRRLAAFFYDLLLLIGVFFVATGLILPFNGGQAFNGQQYFYPCYLLAISFLFFGWFWTHGGQTLGLKAWKIKLQSVDQTKVTWTQACLRFLLMLLTLGVDLVLLIFKSDYQPMHDRWSRTRTVYIIE